MTERGKPTDRVNHESLAAASASGGARGMTRLAEVGRVDEARRAYDRAVSLTTDIGPRRYLERRRARLVDTPPGPHDAHATFPGVGTQPEGSP